MGDQWAADSPDKICQDTFEFFKDWDWGEAILHNSVFVPLVCGIAAHHGLGP